ncbi:hypothetical protein RHSIM_Rhsim02G0174700 [Rhododendron simsii]|uniref:Vps52 coiled-coil domain-containing protein n=1 Tax=Rhododendron simsii TaxID=118357 RepID=A0A834H875_RHOSS|nr:hypothetical protein RHSIM_Rhsim02G0174700 [Rhododendron simsii]
MVGLQISRCSFPLEGGALGVCEGWFCNFSSSALGSIVAKDGGGAGCWLRLLVVVFMRSGWITDYNQLLFIVLQRQVMDLWCYSSVLPPSPKFKPPSLSDQQAEIGSISSDIKVLQEKSMDMGLKLKNRKVAESQLAKFVEDIIVPPRMIDIIVDGEVNDEFMRTLEILSKKLKFVEVDPMVKTSVALKDVLPELERLRQKAVSKVVE